MKKKTFNEDEILKFWGIIKLGEKHSPTWHKGFIKGLAYARDRIKK